MKLLKIINKYNTSKGLEWPMKRKGYKEISIKEKTYERLKEVRFEMDFKTIEETIEELLNIWEDVDTKEDPNYCDNCGDYHD